MIENIKSTSIIFLDLIILMFSLSQYIVEASWDVFWYAVQGTLWTLDVIYMFSNTIVNYYDDFNYLVTYTEVRWQVLIFVLMLPIIIIAAPFVFTYIWLFDDRMDTRQTFIKDL